VVCLLVTLVSPAKTAEHTEMQFVAMTQVGHRNHVLDEGPYRLKGKGTFKELVTRGSMVIDSCTITAESLRLCNIQYTDAKLLASAVHWCSSLEDRHLHLRKISEFSISSSKLHTRCDTLPIGYCFTLQPMA